MRDAARPMWRLFIVAAMIGHATSASLNSTVGAMVASRKPTNLTNMTLDLVPNRIHFTCSEVTGTVPLQAHKSRLSIPTKRLLAVCAERNWQSGIGLFSDLLVKRSAPDAQ
jgi:hypothetical protein